MSQISSDAKSWDERYASQDLVWSQEPNQFVASELGGLEPGQMVDLAGGEGRNALWFAAAGWQVENVEISKVALEKFQLRAEHLGLSGRCHTNLAQAESARFQLEPNLLVIAYLQIPFENLVEALSNSVSQLAPQGRLFGIWHALRNLTEGFGGPPNAQLLPSPEKLTDWARANLSSYKVYEVERLVQKDGLEHVAIDVILSGER